MRSFTVHRRRIAVQLVSSLIPCHVNKCLHEDVTVYRLLSQCDMCVT